MKQIEVAPWYTRIFPWNGSNRGHLIKLGNNLHFNKKYFGN